MEKLATTSMQPIGDWHKLHVCIFHSIIWIMEEKFRKREVKAFFSGPFRVWKGGGILYKKKIQISHWRRITVNIFLSAICLLILIPTHNAKIILLIQYTYVFLFHYFCEFFQFFLDLLPMSLQHRLQCRPIYSIWNWEKITKDNI